MSELRVHRETSSTGAAKHEEVLSLERMRGYHSPLSKTVTGSSDQEQRHVPMNAGSSTDVRLPPQDVRDVASAAHAETQEACVPRQEQPPGPSAEIKSIQEAAED